MMIIDRLKNLIGKFRKGDAPFQTAGDNIFSKHDIYTEKFAVIAEEVEKVYPGQPVIVIDNRNIRIFAKKADKLFL